MKLLSLSTQYNLNALIQNPHGQTITDEKYQQINNNNTGALNIILFLGLI